MNDFVEVERVELELVRVRSHDMTKGWSQCEGHWLTLWAFDFDFYH